MSLRKQTALLILTAFFLQTSSVSVIATAEAAPKRKRGIASESVAWAVSGYLHSDPGKKVYVSMEGDKITGVGSAKPKIPDAQIVETDSVIFPGLMDMHGHVKYNILPLWDKAQSQFLNRFEWRTKFSDYKDAVSFNMKPIKGDAVCAAVRWAELKALAGGSTAIQGIGGDLKCAKDFGVNNIENPADFGNQKVRAMTDMVMPDLVGNVFEKYMAPDMRSKKIDYDTAYRNMLKTQGVSAWVDSFVKENHTVASGLKLLIGDSMGLSAAQSTEKDFDSVKEKLKAYLTKKPYEMKDNAIQKQIDAMKKFLFGNAGADSYLKSKKDEKTALNFITKGGVLTVPSTVRRYIGMFELGVRQSALQYFASKEGKALIAHLAEGRQKDKYNEQEYKYARVFGLTKPGLVVIHGVGMATDDFKNAAAAKISIVWSPFSNLLLYGETLDVAGAKAAGINITLGSDWTPTGSKNIVDELKIARRYLNKKGIKTISNKDLVDMITVNAAKAMRMETTLGKVAPNFKANLTLISCPKGKDPNDCLVESGQSQVQLVVVNGQALYGDREPVEKAAKIFRDDDGPEIFPKQGSGCDFQKAFRFAKPNDYDKEIDKKKLNFRSAASIEEFLKDTLGKYADTVKHEQPRMADNLIELDPIYKCEDKKYAARFDAYIEKELDKNLHDRESLRESQNLTNSWTPFTLTDSGDDEDESGK